MNRSLRASSKLETVEQTKDGERKMNKKRITYTASRWTEDVALFGNSRGTTFKNLTMSNVDIQMTGGANFTWKPWRVRATRVSSVTAGAV